MNLLDRTDIRRRCALTMANSVTPQHRFSPLCFLLAYLARSKMPTAVATDYLSNRAATEFPEVKNICCSK